MIEEELISKKVLSGVLSEKCGKDIEIIQMEKIGSGYHSDGFKATSSQGQMFFIKKFKSNDLGFAYPERKIFSLLISDAMSKRSGKNPSPLGVLIVNNGEAKIIPDIKEDTSIYHVQEFESAGKSYFGELVRKKDKKEMDENDRNELRKVVEYISHIHSIKYSAQNQERNKEVYRDGIRSVINSPELAIMMLHEFDENSPVLNLGEQKEYLGLMYEIMHKWKNRHDRLCALHGDFWGANVFFRQDGSLWVIDYSRIPWGDSGIDIGWWLSQYLWLYHETKNSYFKELGEFFIKEYQEKTGDKEIREATTIVFGLMGLIFTFPKFYPDLDKQVGKSFIKHIIKILKEGTLLWD